MSPKWIQFLTTVSIVTRVPANFKTRLLWSRVGIVCNRRRFWFIRAGGDSGIGRAVALAYAREGASIVISYLNEDEDAKETQKAVEGAGRECILVVSLARQWEVYWSRRTECPLGVVKRTRWLFSVLAVSMMRNQFCSYLSLAGRHQRSKQDYDAVDVSNLMFRKLNVKKWSILQYRNSNGSIS